MNSIFMDYLDQYLTAFIDNLLIYSDNELDHQLHIRAVLQRLREHGLQASIKKYEFYVIKTQYLGFIISTDSIQVDPEKVIAVQKWKTPTTIRGVQSFLGFCNFYQRFIQEYSRVAKPLVILTRKDVPFMWNDNCEKTFHYLKVTLTEAPLLTHYELSLPIKLETDASNSMVASVLS
jgi:hypothetical protein